SHLAGFRLKRGDLSHEIGMGRVAEAGDLDIDDVALEARLDRIDANDVADDDHVERLVAWLPRDPERNRGVWRTAHLVYGLVEAEPQNVLTIDGDDDVVCLQAGLGGGRVVNGRHHLEQPL